MKGQKMIKDQHSDECIDAFQQYLKDTKGNQFSLGLGYIRRF